MGRRYLIQHAVIFLIGTLLSWCLEQWRYSISATSHWMFIPYVMLACIAGFVGWAVLIAQRPAVLIACLYLLGGLILTVSDPRGMGLLPHFLFQAFAAIGFLSFVLYAITKKA